MKLSEKIKTFIGKQKVAREKHAAAVERLEEHQRIHDEKERLEEEERIKRAIGTLTPEEESLLAKRKARLEAEQQRNREKYEKFKNLAVSAFNSLKNYSAKLNKPTRSRRRKRRGY